MTGIIISWLGGDEMSEDDLHEMQFATLNGTRDFRDVNTSDKVCQWKENDEYGYWETGCKGIFEFIEGDIEDNTFKFCPYCGGKIKELRQERLHLD